MLDTIIPIGKFDTSGNEKDSIVLTGWILDGLVDPKKIESAYTQLVKTWPILSARLRTHEKKWQYQLPSEFSSSSPQLIFKTVVNPGSIHAHYNYSKTSDEIRCTIKDNPDDFYSQGGPRSVGELMKRDIPVVQLQLTMFDDATIIGLTTPHVLCDGHGNKEIMIALTRILRGEEVAPLQLGDPMEPILNIQKPPDQPPYWKVFSLWQVISFMACLMWDFIRVRDIQNRELFFPKAEVGRIKEEAIKDLRKEHGEQTDIWVSSSDVLVAFCLKVQAVLPQCIHPPTRSRTPLNVLYAANLRRYLADALPKPYLHNGACTVVTPPLPLSDISTLSLGALAYHIRQTVHSQTDPGVVKNWLRWRIANAGRMTLFFEPTGAWNVVTNWRDMKLMEIDFSGALPDGANTKIKCVYLWGNSFQPFPIRNCMGLVADDPRGGIWMGGFFSEKVWLRKDGFGQFIKG